MKANTLFIYVVLCIPTITMGVQFKVKIRTRNDWYAGTSASVRMNVIGTTDTKNSVYLGDDFQTGTTEYTNVNLNVGRIKRIVVYRGNSGFDPDWMLDYIEMTDSSTGRKYTFDCDCWVKSGKKTIYPDECYYYLPIDNCKVSPVKVECQVGKCTQCKDGYYIDGYVCSSCGNIPDCKRTLCSSMSDRWCTQCRDADLFKLEEDRRACARTCSWENHWCWPGTCGSPDTHNYARDCVCDSTSFRRVYDTTQAKCEITRSPEVLTCRMQVIDQNNDVRMSHVPSGQQSVCSNQQDFYGNIDVKQVVTNTTFDFLINVSQLNAVKPYFVDEYAFGVTDVHFHIVKKTLSGSETVTTFPVKVDPQSDNPLHLLSYDRVLENSGHLVNGQRLCLRLDVQGGGHMISKNVQTHDTHHVPYRKTDTTREICYWYDDTSPRHCLEYTSCSTEPVDSTSRILTDLDFTVTFTGWEDPSPVTGDPRFASGIHTYVVNLYEVKESGTDFLDVAKVPVIPAIEQSSPVEISIPSNLPNPALYAVVLEVKDVANNVRQARRFVMFDNSSSVLARDDRPIYTTTASSETDFKWQTNLGKICYSWIDRYYNDKFYNLNLLKPIKQDHHGLISGVYEQLSGILPISGTVNIHGVTMFHYSLWRDDQLEIPETDVPNFTSQKLCVSPTINDGETYQLDIVAEDVMTHTYTESISTHIDSSEPEIINMWLEKDGYKRLYVHNSSDLSKMVLTFESLDIHSGIYSVDWSLGTTFGGSDIGQGSLGVQRLGKHASCSEEALTCYCPAVGPCSYFNFTLTLNSLINDNTHIGNHNRQYHFTVTVTNVARLVYTKHLDILADDSPPTTGVLMEGPVGAPDIDYTSKETIIVNWAGFIDHESGIKMYKVGLASECLQVTDFIASNTSFSTNKTLTEVTTVTSVRLSLPDEGRYFATVVAYNNAMEPSQSVCSDGIVLDRTPPALVNITLQSATIKETVLCSDNRAWLITGNLTKQQILDSYCNKKCMNSTTNDFVSSLPNNISYATPISQTCEISSTHGIIYLPVDMINIKWDIVEYDSQVHEAFVGIGSTINSAVSPDLIDYHKSPHKYFYKNRHISLSNGDEFYIFVRIINSAGLQTTAVIGPILLDESPPVCPSTLVPSLHDGYVYIHWNRSQFSDNEQQEVISSFFYRIGRQGNLVSGFKPVHNTKCGEMMCFKLDVSNFQKYDFDEELEFYIALYAFNNAGYFCSVNTEPFYLPSIFPPGHGLVYDVMIDKLSPTKRRYDDFDIILASSQFCVAWRGFEHHSDVGYELGVGSTPGDDDVVPFHDVLEVDVLCETDRNLQFYTRYFTVIRASSTGGKTIGISDGFFLVNESDISSSVLQVFDGKGCSERIDIFATSVLLTELEFTLDGIRLHVGHTYTFITNASVSIRSQEVYFYNQRQINHLHYIAMVPVVEFPIFNLSSPRHTNASVVVNIADCNVDDDVVFGADHVSAYWSNNDFQSYVTHYEVELSALSANNLTQTKQTTIAYGKSIGNDHNYSFRDISLNTGRYAFSVRPCVEDVCFKWISSDGFTVMNSIYDDFRIEATLDKTADTCSHVKVTLSNVECPSGIVDKIYDDIIVRWGLFRDSTAATQVTKWSVYHQSGYIRENVTLSQCLGFPVYPHQKLFTCVEIYCPMGPSGGRCVPLTVTEDPNIFDKSRLYELDSDTDFARDIRKYIHATNIGQKLASLHEAELDYTNKPVRIAGTILGLQDRQVTWYLLKDTKHQTCEDNPLCVASINTIGGYSAFQGISLENEVLYYICAEIETSTIANGKVLPAFQTCGDGFIIDGNPPAKGDVFIASQNGYLTDNRHLLVHWDSFHDYHGYESLGYPDSIANYEYSLGSNPCGQDVVAKTSNGRSKSVKIINPNLRSGLTYYVTVTAFDHVGHSSTVVSPGVLYDATPPVVGKVQVGTYLTSQITLGPKINVHWTGFHDVESGIDRMQLGIGSTPSAPDVLEFRDVSGDFASITDLSPLCDGHKYFAIILVTNRAGLSALSSSESFVIDRSPPTEGAVHDGLLNHTPDVDFQANTTHAGCHWSGFSDPHSGVRYFAAGLGTQPSQDDVRATSSTGTKTLINWQQILVPGVKYFCTVKVCNGAGLCTSVSSNGFTADSSPPIPGIVHVGVDGHHSRYWAHPDTIQAQWFGFSDVESGIRSYKVCIRHGVSETCDVLPFTNFLLANYLTIPISLPLDETLVVVVRAENHLGMSTESVSDSFVVDPTSPILITTPVLESVIGNMSGKDLFQFDPSILKIFWKFEDPESPIVKHIVSLKTHHEGHTSVENIHLANINELRLPLSNEEWLKPGDTYVATVTSCNEAGLCTYAVSNNLVIDPTPPHLGGVIDPMVWYSTTALGKTVSVINITVSGFQDVESGIKTYHVAVGKTYSGSEVSDGVLSFVPSNSGNDSETIQSMLNTNLTPGELLIISVWAENHAGLRSAVGKVTVTVVSSNHFDMHGDLEILRHSCDVHYCNKDCTCAVVGQKCHSVDEVIECKSNNQTSSLSIHIDIEYGSIEKPMSASSSCISANWTIGESGAYIMRFEWSMGQAKMPVGTGIFDPLLENLWYDVGHQTSLVHCLSGDRYLLHDTSYAVYVRAWTSTSEYTVFTSNPVHIDSTPPSVRRGRYIKENDRGTCDLDLDFTSTLDTLTACWSGVFTDPQSEIHTYLVSLGTNPGGDDVILTGDVGMNTSISWRDLTLFSGTTYYVTVTAINHLGLHRTLVSDGVLVDREKPFAGVAFNTAHYYNAHTQNSQDVGVSFRGFHDRHSAIESFFVAVDTTGNASSDSLEFNRIGLRNAFMFNHIDITNGQWYRFAVKAVDAAGFESDVIFSPPALYDSSPPTAFETNRFDNLYNETLETENGTLVWTKMLSKEPQTSVYMLHLVFDSVENGDLVEISFEDQKHLHSTRTNSNEVYEIQTSFVSSSIFLGERRITVEMIKAVADTKLQLTLDVSKNVTLSNQTDDCVIVRQLSPLELMITINVLDKESGIKKIYVGAGSTRGGFQIHTLLLVPSLSNVILFTEAPHGQAIYITAIVENHAGIRGHFHSHAIIMDHTPPIISNAVMNTTYISSGEDTLTKVSVTWEVIDAESPSTRCSCAIVVNNSVIIESGMRLSLHHFQTPYLTLIHGSMISAEVTCSNDADLKKISSVGPKLITYLPPDINNAAIYVNTLAETSSEVPVIPPGSPLIFSWGEFDDSYGIQTYSYRILQGDQVTKDWEDTEMRTYVSVEDVSLKNNNLYIVEVTACSKDGIYSKAINASVLVTGDAPVLTGYHPKVTRTGSDFEITWRDVFSVRPELLPTYTVTLGSQEGLVDILRRVVTREQRHVFQNIYDGSDVFILIICAYQTGESTEFREVLSIS